MRSWPLRMKCTQNKTICVTSHLTAQEVLKGFCFWNYCHSKKYEPQPIIGSVQMWGRVNQQLLDCFRRKWYWYGHGITPAKIIDPKPNYFLDELSYYLKNEITDTIIHWGAQGSSGSTKQCFGSSVCSFLWACPVRGNSRGRPTTCWTSYISHLAKERLITPQKGREDRCPSFPLY